MNQSTKIGIRTAILLTFWLITLGLACPGAVAPDRKLMATAGVNIFQASSSDYQDIYGETAVMPELKITYKIFKNFTLWGGFGLVSKQGFIEEVAEAAEIRQNFFNIGVGYAHNLSARLRLRGFGPGRHHLQGRGSGEHPERFGGGLEAWGRSRLFHR